VWKRKTPENYWCVMWRKTEKDERTEKGNRLVVVVLAGWLDD
jgi:hypothetical protein